MIVSERTRAERHSGTVLTGSASTTWLHGGSLRCDLAAAGPVAQTSRVDVGGSVQRRFEPVREVFAQLLAGQRGTGSAVAAWRDGAWVVDLWGGRADAAGTRRWQSDSLAQPYSVSKPFAAVCALLLVDRGQLELDAPVQRYWPQFRAPADVRQLLSHQAGVVALDDPGSH